MRKFLIASHKGGAGTTTTAVNLAAAAARSGTPVLLVDADPLGCVVALLNLQPHPDAQQLAEAGVAHRVKWLRAPATNLDVLALAPTDLSTAVGDIPELLRLLDDGFFRDRYEWAVLDGPPGAWGETPRQLLSACDDLLLVLRAEPMAYRTLPPMLRLVRRVQSESGAAQNLRGILLTLPPGEVPGGEWDLRLRERFGTYLLPRSIPFDPEVGKASLMGQSLVLADPASAAARQFQALALELGIAREVEAGAAPLLAAEVAEPPLHLAHLELEPMDVPQVEAQNLDDQ